MKNIHIFGSLILAIALSAICMSFTKLDGNTSVIKNGLAAIPDLKIAAVTVSGGSPCGGNLNKVRVVIWNGGSGPTKGKIQVRMNIVPLDSAVVKNSYAVIYPNQFKTITFSNINLKRGDNRIQAVVNQKKTMPETNYKNNGKTVSIKAPQFCDY